MEDFKTIVLNIITRLDGDIERVSKELQHPDRMIRDMSSEKKTQEDVDEYFSSCQNALKIPAGQKENIFLNNREYLVIKRRKQAVIHLLREAEKRYADRFPDLSVPDEFLLFNAPLAALTFDQLNHEYYVELAAAIWILDYLKEKDLFEEAASLFPRSREEINSVYLPDLTDALHSDDELKSVIYIIQNRNRGLSGFDENRSFCDEADTKLKKKSGVESVDRKNYDSLLALIDKNRIKSAQEKFVSYIWQLFENLLSQMNTEKADLNRQKASFLRSLTSQRASYAEMIPQKIAPALLGNGDRIVQEVKNKSDSFQNLIPFLTQRSKELDEKAALISEKETAINAMYSLVMLFPAFISGKLSDLEMMERFSDVTPLRIYSPYEMCFAFLSLLDDNSDEVWIYNLSYDVLAFACQALPWADSNVVDPDDTLEEMQIDFEHLRELADKTPDWDDISDNEMMYEDRLPSLLMSQNSRPMSISQLVFISSGVIPPRVVPSVSFTKALLNAGDFSKEQQDLIYSYIALAYSFNHRNSDLTPSDEEQVADHLSEDEGEVRNKEEQIKHLRGEIKHLRNVIHQLDRKNRDLSHELDESSRKVSQTASELAELRSMIRESSAMEESESVSVSFPYTVRRRTVIIGGHESWVKAIKPLLNHVRYIGASQQPNPQVILNAEAVWIQSNAMGHSSFYKIIDLIRRNDIKVYYFKYASAEKCAEQIVKEESDEELIEKETQTSDI